jgi:hypothetical protein
MLLFRQIGQNPDHQTYATLMDSVGRVETENHRLLSHPVKTKCLNKPSLSFSFICTHSTHCILMKPRDIFGLAVRLLGLFFLYLGLRTVTPLLDLSAIETASKSDIINAIPPIVFNLAVAWWLLGGGLLMRRAYPEAPKSLNHSPPQTKPATATSGLTPSPALTNMDRAEKRLVSLVEKPKNDRATQP